MGQCKRTAAPQILSDLNLKFLLHFKILGNSFVFFIFPIPFHDVRRSVLNTILLGSF